VELTPEMEQTSGASNPYDHLVDKEQMTLIHRLVNELPDVHFYLFLRQMQDDRNFFITLTLYIPKLHNQPLFIGEFMNLAIDRSERKDAQTVELTPEMEQTSGASNPYDHSAISL